MNRLSTNFSEKVSQKEPIFFVANTQNEPILQIPIDKGIRFVVQCLQQSRRYLKYEH